MLMIFLAALFIVSPFLLALKVTDLQSTLFRVIMECELGFFTATCTMLSCLTRMWAEEPVWEIAGHTPGPALGFRGQGRLGQKWLGRSPPHSPSFPLPGREKRVPHARRPWAVVCNSRDGLKTYSCYISCGLIESRSLKFSSLILLYSLFFLHSFSVNCCHWCFSFC